MGKTFLYTTDNSTAFIIVHGKDEAHAQTVAEQAISALPGIKLQGRQDVTHSVIVNLSITMLSKAKSDDIFIRRLLERFKDRGARIEVKNDVRDDGSVEKKILVNDRREISLNLTREQVQDFEENGIGDEIMDKIYQRLEFIIGRLTAAKPEIVLVEDGEEEGEEKSGPENGDSEGVAAEIRGGGRERR
jgi:hypothetical protein